MTFPGSPVATMGLRYAETVSRPTSSSRYRRTPMPNGVVAYALCVTELSRVAKFDVHWVLIRK